MALPLVSTTWLIATSIYHYDYKFSKHLLRYISYHIFLLYIRIIQRSFVEARVKTVVDVTLQNIIALLPYIWACFLVGRPVYLIIAS